MVNNELDTKNTTMSDNMKALNKLVFITASQDTMVIPKESERYDIHFIFFYFFSFILFFKKKNMYI